MRGIFSLLGLVAVLLVVGLLVKKQLQPSNTAGSQPKLTDTYVVVPTGTPRQQIEQIRQQLDTALQQPARTLPDEK